LRWARLRLACLLYASDLPKFARWKLTAPTRHRSFADDGQLARQLRVAAPHLMTYEQCPKILYNAVTAIEDQHFEEHWGIDFPAHGQRRFSNLVKRRITGGASTITMQLAGNLFLDRSDAAFAAKCRKFCWRCNRTALHEAANFTMYGQSGISSAR